MCVVNFFTQHWFIVDLPRRSHPAQQSTEFESNLLDHMASLACPVDFIDSIKGKYDYSAVEHVKIVSSVPSSAYYKDGEENKYGAGRLRMVVKPWLDEARRQAEHKSGRGREINPVLKLELCTATMGGMQQDWIKAMWHAFSGGHHRPVHAPKTSSDRHEAYIQRTTSDIESQQRSQSDGPCFDFVFPTHKDIQTVRPRAAKAAGQIGAHFNWETLDPTLRRQFWHYVSRDQMVQPGGSSNQRGCLFHSKSYLAFLSNPIASSSESPNLEPPVYMYIGSANFSKAAWGKLIPSVTSRPRQYDPAPSKAKFQPELNRLADMCNFELGVLVRGKDVEGMLEPGSTWDDIVPYARPQVDERVTGYRDGDRPYRPGWSQ